MNNKYIPNIFNIKNYNIKIIIVLIRSTIITNWIDTNFQLHDLISKLWFQDGRLLDLNNVSDLVSTINKRLPIPYLLQMHSRRRENGSIENRRMNIIDRRWYDRGQNERRWPNREYGWWWGAGNYPHPRSSTSHHINKLIISGLTRHVPLVFRELRARRRIKVYRMPKAIVNNIHGFLIGVISYKTIAISSIYVYGR